MDIPGDLVPLPTSPWDERPTEIPLDVQEVRTAIWLERGNITKAAERLKVSSGRLRKFVNTNSFLSAELQEANEQLADIATDVVYDALTDVADKGRQDQMARFVLNSPVGRARGFGTGPSKNNININAPKGTLSISWEDGSSIAGPSDDGKTIEGVANDR